MEPINFPLCPAGHKLFAVVRRFISSQFAELFGRKLMDVA